MTHVETSRQGLLDLDQIWSYIARDTIEQADRFLDKIQAKLEMLARQPLIGESRDDLGRNVREAPIGNYVIFYRPIPDGVEVVRVLHGARNIRNLD
jgi:toxin ParE1/3/4